MRDTIRVSKGSPEISGMASGSVKDVLMLLSFERRANCFRISNMFELEISRFN